jgi:hypothetical protein
VAHLLQDKRLETSLTGVDHRNVALKLVAMAAAVLTGVTKSTHGNSETAEIPGARILPGWMRRDLIIRVADAL